MVWRLVVRPGNKKNRDKIAKLINFVWAFFKKESQALIYEGQTQFPCCYYFFRLSFFFKERCQQEFIDPESVENCC